VLEVVHPEHVAHPIVVRNFNAYEVASASVVVSASVVSPRLRNLNAYEVQGRGARHIDLLRSLLQGAEKC
jgi:hypothetical protein